MSLASGKKGQNVRLASKLIGWDIDIKSEEEKRQEIEEQMTALTAPATPLTSLAGVGAKTIEKIETAGGNFLGKLSGKKPEKVVEKTRRRGKKGGKNFLGLKQLFQGGPRSGGTASGGAWVRRSA